MDPSDEAGWITKAIEWTIGGLLLLCTTMMAWFRKHTHTVHARMDEIEDRGHANSTNIKLIQQHDAREVKAREADNRLRDSQRKEVITMVRSNHGELMGEIRALRTDFTKKG